MIELRIPQLLENIRDSQAAYHKLTVVAGEPRSGKTTLLKQVAEQLDLPLINFSLLLSQRLLSQSRRQRSLKAGEVALEVVDEHMGLGLCLDDTELLFDSTLQMNPLVFLKDISRNRLIVATWNGGFIGGKLLFGPIGHPDYFSQTVKGYPVVCIAAEDKLQLHLTS